MNPTAASSTARRIMMEFADLTGLLENDRPPRRYLWTDAFAVCNFLELYRQTDDDTWRNLALHLVDQVHRVLGRHRSDGHRSGWISGLHDEEGEHHPTRRGLRIGKPLNERRPDEPADERLEWDRDGQYYHYLTKWMHALHRVSRVTEDPIYLLWAMELAKAAHAAFCHTPSWGGEKRLYWKMSIDLARPQVASMGQHDPLDGMVTCYELQAAARKFGKRGFPDLRREIADLTAICRRQEMATDDPLGIGGLLWDARRMAELIDLGELTETGFLQDAVEAALEGLGSYSIASMTEFSGRYRLAFRELGLSIGLKGVERLPELVDELPGELLKALAGHVQLAERIDSFWLDGRNQESSSWREHREINMVMLATSLAPEEFLAAGKTFR